MTSIFGKCPNCKEYITRDDVYVSCCTDLDCCGIEHEITHKCHYFYSTFDYDDLVDKLKEFGNKSDKKIIEILNQIPKRGYE